MSVYKAIARFPSYLICESGDVLSLRCNRNLKPLAVPNGYRHVVLVEDGEKFRCAVHRLVAEAFYGAPPHGMVVNHKNGSKCDNSANNLEWVTISENSLHAYSSGLRTISDYQKSLCAALGRSKRTTTDEVERAIISEFNGVRGQIEMLSKKYGVTRYVISRIISGEKNECV